MRALTVQGRALVSLPDGAFSETRVRGWVFPCESGTAESGSSGGSLGDSVYRPSGGADATSLPWVDGQKLIQTPALNDLPSSGAHTSVIHLPSAEGAGRSSGS